MVSSDYERKKRYLLSLYPDLEEGESEDERSAEGIWDAPFERETATSTGDSSTTEESIGSLSAHGTHDPSLQKPRKPFWVPSKGKSRRKSKSYKSAPKSELHTLDESPAGISPDADGDDDAGNKTFRFYMIILSSLLLVGMGIAIVILSLTFVRKNSSAGDPNSEPGQVHPESPTDNIFVGDCDVSVVEAICRLEENKERELDLLSEVPKCIQDTFNLVYVKAGHDAYYQLESIKSLRSCSSEGMALKRLAAMEHKQPTAGKLLSCDYTAYTWYYEYGEVGWWTEEGAAQTNVCERDDVFCDADSIVEAFVDGLGEECLLSTLSLAV